MERVLWYGMISSLVLICSCQSSTLVINVVEVGSTADVVLDCNVSQSTTLTRWTYLSGPTGTSLMSYQNGRCTVSPSDSFLSDNRYSYACNRTMYQGTIKSPLWSFNNHILACRDAVQPDESGSTWMIKINQGDDCAYCKPTITFNVQEVTEGDNVTFTCRVSSDVAYVNWNWNIGSKTAAMNGQNEQCDTSPSGATFLNNTSKYTYICNNTVYQLTILKVQRSEHNDIYMCIPSGQAEGTGSNWIIKVKAQVTTVTISPSKYLVNVKENTHVELNCTTSTARPAASIYWYRHPNGSDSNETGITDNITTTTDYNDLRITTSILHFVPTRQDNETKIFCRANNSVNTTPVRSNKKRILNVLFKADDPYVLQGSEYRVIEDTLSTLSCTVKGGNPTPTLSWSFNNVSPTHQSTIYSNGNVTTTLTWNVSRKHKGICTCTSRQTEFQNKTSDVSVIVLYPPSKPVFKVKGRFTNGDVHFIEGNSRFIKCIAYSKPSPDKYTWTGPRISGSIDIQALNLSNIRKMDAGEYKCSVHNTMNPSSGGHVAGISNRVVKVVVLYPPSALYFVYGNHSGQNISHKAIGVIKGDSFDIVCKPVDGYPSPRIRWNEQNDNVDLLSVTGIEESRTNATCTATNDMQETNRDVVQGHMSDTITFNVLVRPTINGCEFYYNSRPTDVNSLTNDKLVIIENESFTLKCSTDGKPTPTVWWKIPQSSLESSPSLTVNNLTRQMHGEYVFSANSILEPSFKDKENVTVNKTVTVEVLYPPAVLPINNIWRLKGERLNMVCDYTAGLPETTFIKWTRNIDNGEWNTTTLNIESLKKSDTGIYTCSASNTMIQRGDNKSYIGQHNQSFHLDVQYAASIKSFSINTFTSENVTINESDSVLLKCTAESNPAALLTLSRKSKTLKNVKSNNIEYNIEEAKCLDAATYYCLANNTHNGANRVQNMMQLFVNCYPRKAEEIDGNITSEKHTTVKIGFNVIAYPPPNFTWYQLVDDNWTRLHDGDNYIIESANLLSTLTIQSVDIEEFTSYKVIAENDFGDIEQIYTLLSYDKPDPPTRLRHIDDLTTTSSIHIEWKPGFDNGPPQTFYIKYKKSSDTVWNYRNVNDNGEPTMNITLTDLLENTQYDVIIYASNVKGNSTESDVLATRTKATPIPPSAPGALIGGIAGGVTSCIVIVIIIIFIIRRYPLFKGNGAARQDIRRSVSDDSDDEDGLVDNPMYESSSNVARVASTSASTSTDIYSKPLKPNKTNVADNEDIYSVVNKIKGQGNGGTCKSTNGKDKQKEGNVYENFELDNDPRKADVGKQLPPEPPPTASKLKIVNQDGLIYADLVFKDKPHGEKMAILGDDPTPYDLVDFTKKAEPLPESDE